MPGQMLEWPLVVDECERVGPFLPLALCLFKYEASRRTPPPTARLPPSFGIDIAPWLNLIFHHGCRSALSWLASLSLLVAIFTLGRRCGYLFWTFVS
eukprot:scaffold160065_cov27-Tisochrysis_lutea.AAC.2